MKNNTRTVNNGNAATISQDVADCSFCGRSTPVWELEQNNGECDTCAAMDYVERQALIADENVLRSESRGFHHKQ